MRRSAVAVVGWELEGMHEEEAAPGSCVTVTSSQSCKGRV